MKEVWRKCEKGVEEVMRRCVVGEIVDMKGRIG